MKQRRVWRYTCEHCKKSNCSKSSMVLHEARCFRNPARKCPVCGRQWPVAELAAPIAAMSEIDETTEPAMLAAISEVAENCPACICSVISQAPLPMVKWDNPGEFHFGVFHEGSHGEYRYRVTFDYKKARDEYRAETAAENGWMGCAPF